MDLEFKTLTFKIDGLWAEKRVFNHKSIPIYNFYIDDDDDFIDLTIWDFCLG